MIERIDRFMTDNKYRQTFHKDEYMELFESFGITYVPHREWLTKSEVYDQLLDMRFVHMKEEEENGSIQEELDSIVGADISVS